MFNFPLALQVGHENARPVTDPSRAAEKPDGSGEPKLWDTVSALLHVGRNITIYDVLEACVDYGPFSACGWSTVNSLFFTKKEALLRRCERRGIQGVRRLNGQDESGEDDGSVAADRWRHRCVRQAAERKLGQLRPRRASSGWPGYSKARTWPR